ncbi:MAG: ECF transporter S component [Clostridiales bacterium]|jgi:uncharacterized membrane protein|nr:ECF transporter S component [Clostridiales bacterium]MDR2751661.1 ECF transporter S component [Clostridiales bacterium]
MSEAPKVKEAKKPNIAFLAQFAILAAIEAIFCFTPLGSLPIGPIVATLAGVPVIVTAIILGVRAGTLMGLLTGIFSTIIWTFMPPQPYLAFVFSPFAGTGASQRLAALFISNVPRILVGLIAGVSYILLSKAFTYKKGSYKDLWAYGIAAFLGSMANTIFVLGGIYAFLGKAYADLNGISYDLLLTVLAGSVATNGMLEALICVIAAIFICRPLKIITSRKVR